MHQLVDHAPKRSHNIKRQPEFEATRLGVIMRPDPNRPHEAWGVLNPGGVRARDGSMHLFPRIIAEGNYSRIAHGRVVFRDGKPSSVERLGIALEPSEPYEVNSGGGGVEDARVVYIAAIDWFVMTYTAFVPYEAKVAVAVSKDLETWQRIGLLKYDIDAKSPRQLTGNKDAAFFPVPVIDANGVESLAILHRPTTRVVMRLGEQEIVLPPKGRSKRESIWISYVPLAAVRTDVANLICSEGHAPLLAPKEPWEAVKIGAGAPPIRLPGGWLLVYHGVARIDDKLRYSMGIAIFDLERPTRILYRARLPVIEPTMDFERTGLVADVVFPSAGDLREDGTFDVYYGAADHVIAAARVTIPDRFNTA
jgi:predicted GH43/DUF377 family glycosyl hydrolase